MKGSAGDEEAVCDAEVTPAKAKKVRAKKGVKSEEKVSEEDEGDEKVEGLKEEDVDEVV